MSTTAADVGAYWDGMPCGSKHATHQAGSTEYFAEVEAARDRLEPNIAEFADFARWRGRQVLEVGVGLGTDFVRFARAGADLTGVDLSARSVELVQQRLANEGLEARVIVANAEELPLPSDSFDLVYSWGVIHHAPDPERVVGEIHRVLRPGGEVRAMLYNSRSWFALAVWGRYLARGHVGTVKTALARSLESPGTRAYTRSELLGLFSAFRGVELRRWATAYDRRVAGPLATDRLGWNYGVTATR